MVIEDRYVVVGEKERHIPLHLVIFYFKVLLVTRGSSSLTHSLTQEREREKNVVDTVESLEDISCNYE